MARVFITILKRQINDYETFRNYLSIVTVGNDGLGHLQSAHNHDHHRPVVGMFVKRFTFNGSYLR